MSDQRLRAAGRQLGIERDEALVAGDTAAVEEVDRLRSELPPGLQQMARAIEDEVRGLDGLSERGRRAGELFIARDRRRLAQEQSVVREAERRQAEDTKRYEDDCRIRGADTSEMRDFVAQRFATEVSGVQRIWKEHGRVAWSYVDPYLARGKRASDIIASLVSLDDPRQVTVAWKLAHTPIPAARRLVDYVLGVGGPASTIALPVDDRAVQALVAELERELSRQAPRLVTEVQG